MNSTIGNIFKYLLYFILPFIIYYLLNYTINTVSQDKLIVEYVYSLEDTIKPSATYFDFLPNEQNIDKRILNLNYTTDEVIKILATFLLVLNNFVFMTLYFLVNNEQTYVQFGY